MATVYHFASNTFNGKSLVAFPEYRPVDMQRLRVVVPGTGRFRAEISLNIRKRPLRTHVNIYTTLKIN